MAPPARQVAVHFSHRAEQLTDLAKEVGAAWGAALVATPGAVDKAVDAVEQLCAQRVTVRSTHPLGCVRFEGLDVLRQRLADMHTHQQRKTHAAAATTGQGASCSLPTAPTTPAMGARGSTPYVPAGQQARVVLAAADEQSDTAFCLLQLPGDKMSAAAPHTGDGGPAHVLLKMDVQLDDVSRCVTAITERGQLPASMATFPDDELAAQHLAGQQQRAPPFPAHLLTKWAALKAAEGDVGAARRAWSRVHTHGDKRVGPGSEVYDRVLNVLSAWMRARNTGTDTQALLDEAGCGAHFELMDAFGMVPLLCRPVPEEAGMPARDAARSAKSAQLETEGDVGAPRGKEEERARMVLMDQARERAEHARDMVARAGRAETPVRSAAASGEDVECLVRGPQVLELFTAMKDVYDIDCRMLDTAVSMDLSAAFLHWRATQRNRVTGVECDVEGMEVDLLDPATGRLKAVYLFRDLMDFEQAMLDA